MYLFFDLLNLKTHEHVSPTVPPAPNLDVQSFTSTTITVTVYYDTLCPIVEFDFAVDEEKSLSQEAQEYYGKAHFTNLKPNTTYTITSFASNSAGRGPSTTIHQTTAPDCKYQ